MEESKTYERKQTITNSFLKTVSAYANFESGIIEFGIADNRKTIGIENPREACLVIENKINDSIRPKPDFWLQINEKNNTIVLKVERGQHKPYLYKGKAYRRSDTATIEVDSNELRRLALEGSNLNFEELESNNQKLTFESLGIELKDKLNITTITSDILKTFGLYTNKNKFNVAAELLADSNNFPGIDIARFGDSINDIYDRKAYTNVSVLTEYDDAIRFYRNYYKKEVISGSERKMCETVPEVAFREAIANGLIHRTWDVSAHIRVLMFADRIEVVSPGGLPYGVSENDYRYGMVSILRNPILGNVFYRLGYIEKFGTGIRRIMDSYRDNPSKPEFYASENSIKVVLPVISDNIDVSDDACKMLNVMSANQLYTSEDIATILGWSKATAIRRLNDLKQAGLVKVYGNGKNTNYAKL